MKCFQTGTFGKFSFCSWSHSRFCFSLSLLLPSNTGLNSLTDCVKIIQHNSFFLGYFCATSRAMVKCTFTHVRWSPIRILDLDDVLVPIPFVCPFQNPYYYIYVIMLCPLQSPYYHLQKGAHKTDYQILQLHSPPYWIPATWSHVHPGLTVKYLGIPFGVGLVDCYVGLMPSKTANKLCIWHYKDLPFVGKFMVVRCILQALHVYYVSSL